MDRLSDERVRVAAAYWLDASPHERTEEDGLILAQYARQAMNEIELKESEYQASINKLHRATQLAREYQKENTELAKALQKAQSMLMWEDSDNANRRVYEYIEEVLSKYDRLKAVD